MKKQTRQQPRIRLDDIVESRKGLAERELSEVELKVVSGGRMAQSEGGTCSDSGDCDA